MTFASSTIEKNQAWHLMPSLVLELALCLHMLHRELILECIELEYEKANKKRVKKLLFFFNSLKPDSFCFAALIFTSNLLSRTLLHLHLLERNSLCQSEQALTAVLLSTIAPNSERVWLSLKTSTGIENFKV